MGLPSEWVTHAANRLSTNQQLKALGNGVVPLQAIAGIAHATSSLSSMLLKAAL